ncbi:MAG: hypothetical protein JJ971_15575 [Balneolaceae bacterium]|nr:hypothetical protein [Balneolaceae bacterium]MBO6547821.1 hypothetical protein [Balneolaceae bacterium]MBO6648332.1 hypothetical protein [Balneolaceae bacterium]
MNFGLLVILILLPVSLVAQEFESNQDIPSPRTAFLRSLVVPGWGHHYVDKTNWTRGQYHLAADVAMILSYAGLRVRGTYLETELETYVLSRANANIGGRDRDFLLAVANFDNLQDYNEFQLRARNWNDLLPDVPGNEWNWDEDASRFQYQDMRERVDKNNNQLPTIITLMVVNRVISGLSAYNHARRVWDNAPQASVSYLNEFGQPGITAHLRFDF